MSAMIRQLKIMGYIIDQTTPAIVTVKVNNVEVFSGTIEVVSPVPEPSTPPVTYPLLVAEYAGVTEVQMFPMEITVIQGTVAFGEVMVATDANWFQDGWVTKQEIVDGQAINDGRSNILINGALPSWPADGGPTLPGGTPENPIWTGWAFRMPVEHTMTFDYNAETWYFTETFPPENESTPAAV